MTKTTSEWLDEIKTDQQKFSHWLQRQYVGEALAERRIAALAAEFNEGRAGKILNKIASDEGTHREWIAKLLEVRNIPLPEITYDGDRYWAQVLHKLGSFEELAAAGHHAEAMRLIRIKALADDPDIDADIRDTFKRILPDEEFHSKAFAALSNTEAIDHARAHHELGLEALGLTI